MYPGQLKCKAATLGSNMLKTRSNTVGICKTQNTDRTAHTEHIECIWTWYNNIMEVKYYVYNR